MQKLVFLLSTLFFVSLASVSTSFAEETFSPENDSSEFSKEDVSGNGLHFDESGNVVEEQNFRASKKWVCTQYCDLTGCQYPYFRTMGVDSDRNTACGKARQTLWNGIASSGCAADRYGYCGYEDSWQE